MPGLKVEGKRQDPYRGFKFRVLIGGFVSACFHKVTGLKADTEVVDYREGQDGNTMRRLPGITKFDPIMLERGISVNNDLEDWHYRVHNPRSNPVPEENMRKNIVIQLLDFSGALAKEWTVIECWPSSYDVGDLDAESSAVLLESVELQNEGMVRTFPGSGSSLQVLVNANV